MKVISFENVSAWYGNLLALENVNFQIEEKDFTGIIGPNGGGKSTLLKILLGLKKPDIGKVTVNPDCKNLILGYVPQFTTFSKDFPINVMDVVLMGLIRNKKFPFIKFTNEDKEKSIYVLEKVGIANLKDRKINSLSGGQLQKVMIARALVADPHILVLDEPVSNIDAKSETEIYELLKNMNNYMTIIMVSHNTAMISTYFKTLLCVNKNVYHHQKDEMDMETLERIYGCPMELFAHGKIPHRIMRTHKGVLNA